MLLTKKHKIMKLSQLKKHLSNVNTLDLTIEGGKNIPSHFHITETGLTTKHFIDCGGKIRKEKTVSFQVWVASDTKHRLEPSKLKKIIGLAEPLFENEDLEVEIEYQTDTVGRFGLDFQNDQFILTPKFTDCLAKENCGVPLDKQKVYMKELTNTKESCCTPGGGCCN